MPISQDTYASASCNADALARIAHDHTLVYHVANISAESLPELNSAATSQLVVSGLFSDQTIYASPSDNWLLRAWHDTVHLALQADTGTDGEHRVTLAQCAEIERYASPALADILYADLYGQTMYYAHHHAFPTNQARFVWQYLANGSLAQC